jgi:hypothetical protein
MSVDQHSFFLPGAWPWPPSCSVGPAAARAWSPARASAPPAAAPAGSSAPPAAGCACTCPSPGPPSHDTPPAPPNRTEQSSTVSHNMKQGVAKTEKPLVSNFK